MISLDERPYYPALDGIRGLAILLVIGFHNFGYIPFFENGWIGVDLFFVLSGYLITDILLKTLGKRHYLKQFFIRRFLRIFPVYYIVLFFCFFLFTSIPSLKDNLEYYQQNQLWLWLYLQNWLFIFKTPENTHFLVHFWSLAIEEQFYLFWPFIILFLRVPKLILTTISLFFIAFVVFRIILWYNSFISIDLNYFYTFTRIDGICIGCILALVRFQNIKLISKHKLLISLLVTLLNIIFYLSYQNNGFPNPYWPFLGYTSFSILFALLINEAISKDSNLTKICFNVKPLKFLGKISYGLYIFHLPVFKFIYPKMRDLLTTEYNIDTFFSSFIGSIIATILGLIIAIVSYYSIESYFQKIKLRLQPSI